MSVNVLKVRVVSILTVVLLAYFSQMDSLEVAAGSAPNKSAGEPSEVFPMALCDGMRYNMDMQQLRAMSAAVLDSDTVNVGPGKRVFLGPNVPNPFEVRTVISYSIPEPTHVELTVYDAFYHKIVTLVDEERSAGEHLVTFDRRTIPEGAASGMLFYVLTTRNDRLIRRMMLVK
jgi:hypothetical protein